MGEETFEYECMRAELLGTQRPSLDEYLDRQKYGQFEEVEEENKDIENLKEVERESEDLKNVSGKLQELSSILSHTQKRINRFKDSCGSSLTNLLKIKVGMGGSSDSIVSNSDNEGSKECEDVNKPSEKITSSQIEEPSCNPRKSDLAKALDNRMDTLDRLIAKSEECELSMKQQNKDMKKFLR